MLKQKVMDQLQIENLLKIKNKTTQKVNFCLPYIFLVGANFLSQFPVSTDNREIKLYFVNAMKYNLAKIFSI